MKLQYIIFSILVVGMLSGASFALAGETITLPNPLCPTGGGPNCIDSFPKLVDKVLDYVYNIMIGLGTIMLVWAGILFVTSAGDPGKAGKAKQAVIYAIIGLAIGLAGKGLAAVIKAVVTTGV